VRISNQKERLITQLAGVVKTIAGGDNAKARRDLQRWVDDLKALQRRGALSETTVTELAGMAGTVLAALPA
jgi:hypothetical protein